jgi:hypothetical protein
MRLSAQLAAVVCACLLASCGYVGEPLYPTYNIPSPVTDLNAIERGDNILVVFTIPPLTTDGLPLKEVGALDLRAGPYSGSLFDTDAWANAATPWAIISPGKPGLVRGHFPVKSYIGQSIVIGVRSANPRGRFSSWSNLVTLAVTPPLSAPANLKAANTPKGVSLAWDAGTASSWRVYRQAASESQPALLGETNHPTYLDLTSAFGTKYSYYVQALSGRTESEIAGPAVIEPEDTFPPETPSGLVAVTGAKTIELSWTRSTETNLKEYRVYRAAGSGEFTLLASGIVAPAYSDSAIVSGTHYRYEVAAVDTKGNVSARSAPVDAVAP